MDIFNLSISKWNFKTHKYEPYNPEYEPVLYTPIMEQNIHCTECGKEMLFQDSFTSKTIHNNYGLGYPVCESCYNKELEDENKYGKD